MDHPGDAALVEFPDGQLVNINPVTNSSSSPPNATQDDIVSGDAARVDAQDISSVISALGNASVVADIIPSRGPLPFDISKVLAFGHSRGGATIAQAMINDTRIAGGSNIDGPLLADSSYTGLNQPFLIISASNHESEPYWNRIWPKLTAFKSRRSDSQH